LDTQSLPKLQESPSFPLQMPSSLQRWEQQCASVVQRPARGTQHVGGLVDRLTAADRGHARTARRAAEALGVRGLARRAGRRADPVVDD
jgi:hypothetical protein